jgi:hypothetical protein
MAETRTSSWRRLSISRSSNLVSLLSRRFMFAEVGLDAVDLFGEASDVVFGRHMLDDVAEHFAEFLECRFRCCHMRKYSTVPRFRKTSRRDPTHVPGRVMLGTAPFSQLGR